MRRRHEERRARDSGDPLQIIEGILAEPLLAATNTLTGPTTATVDEIKWDTATDFRLTGNSFTATNRDETLEFGSGQKITCARIHGEWRPLAGGGSSGNSVIHFTIVDWIPAPAPGAIYCDFVIADITKVSCRSTAQVGDQVLVADPGLCWFNLPLNLLIGSRGVADWINIEDIVAEFQCPNLLYEYGIDDCMWIVSHLMCCREELYA